MHNSVWIFQRFNTRVDFYHLSDSLYVYLLECSSASKLSHNILNIPRVTIMSVSISMLVLVVMKEWFFQEKKRSL